MSSSNYRGNSFDLVPTETSSAHAAVSSHDPDYQPGSVQELQHTLDRWQPFRNGHEDPTWKEFMREQEKVERQMMQMERQLSEGIENNNTMNAVPDGNWVVAEAGSSNGFDTLKGSHRDVETAGSYSGREVMTWPSPVIKKHHNGLTSFQLDVDVGDTYRPEEIHVNIVDGHMLHIHAQSRYSRRQVKDNTLSSSRQLCEFDRRFALPDHSVRPENLTCLVSPEGILHIRGFLGNNIVHHRQLSTPEGKKDSKTKRRKVNFAVFGSKKSR